MELDHNTASYELSGGKGWITEFIYLPREEIKKKRHITMIKDACYGYDERLLREEGRLVVNGFFMDDAIEIFETTGELVETIFPERELPMGPRATIDIAEYNPVQNT